MKKIKSLIFAVILVNILLSCSTMRGKNYKDDKAMMYGMVYDGNDMCVSDVKVYADEKLIAVSDMRGRFILKFYFGKIIDKEKHKIRLEKKGYENVESEIFYDPMSLLYLRMHSAQELIIKIEENIEQRNYGQAEKIADKVCEIKGYELDGIFLKAVIKLKQGNKQGAKTLLESVKDKNNIYIKKFLEKLN